MVLIISGAEMKKKIVVTGFLVAVVAAILLADRFNLLFYRKYSAQDFGIEIIRSNSDFDEDGIDDSMDIMLGARRDAQNHPRYDSGYYAGGYPPDDVGVCTDVIWRGFKSAGFDLRKMVDQDIMNNPDDYPITDPDSNIDFRRVRNLRVFFDHYAQKLTTDLRQLDQWQPGDIVIFNDGAHIGIVSDIRNSKGQPYIIHNGGQPVREEDYLKRKPVITAHYRFNSELIDDDMLIRWED